MKIRLTRKAIFVGVSYLVACGILVILWDFVFAFELPFSSNILAGILTIIGGFLLAYWLIESHRIEREAEQRKQELERRKRVLSALKAFKNFLLPWLFHYAYELSGEFGMYDQNRIYTGKYKHDIPQLEDIFGIRVWDKDGKLVRGTNTGKSDDILKHPFTPQFLYSSLDYGLRMLEQVEGRLKEFPSFVEEVDPEVAKIVHLSDFIRSRVAELKEWEKEHDKKRIYTIDSSPRNLAIRHNLRWVGRLALDVVIAIDANIRKLEAEL